MNAKDAGDGHARSDVEGGAREVNTVAPRRDRALVTLRSRGERVTPGRRAVIEVLVAQPGHVDAERVAALVDEREPGIHRATIYRSLQALVEAGVVTHTHVPGGATIYHLTALPDERIAGPAGDPARGDQPEGGGDAIGGDGIAVGHGHAHLQCAQCGRFLDVDSAEFAPLVARIHELTGFTVDPQHGALLGTCATCQHGTAESGVGGPESRDH